MQAQEVVYRMPSVHARGRPTIRHVAAAAGVAVSTASLALNGSPRVRPETRQRVLQAAEELQYHPNAAAQRLARLKSGLVAVVVPALANSFFATVVHEIQLRMQTLGMDVILYNTEDDPVLEARHIESLARNQVDGAVFVGEHRLGEDPNAGAIRQLQDSGIRVVLVERQVPGLAAPQIWADKEAGARQAVRHLLALGHRRIAFVGGLLDAGGSYLRRRGYETALREEGIVPDPRWVGDGRFTSSGGYAVTQALLRADPSLTAFFVSNDLMAIGALKALEELGRRVPADVSLVGVDNIAEARYLKPALTTVDISPQRLGQEAGEALSALLQGRSAEPWERRIPAELIVRDSTGPAASRRGGNE